MLTLKLILLINSLSLMCHTLFDPTGTPHSSLKKLFSLTDINANDLPFIVDETNRKYRRQPGTELWDLDTQDLVNHEEIRQLFDKLGYIQEIKPTKKKYKYIVLFGALASRVKVRLEYLINLLKNGIQAEKIIVLGSNRPAHIEHESHEKLSEIFGYPVLADKKYTEYTIMKELIEHSELARMHTIAIEIYSAPNHVDGSRATAEDTVNMWISTEPECGDVLCISNQPFVWYQNEVAQSLLPNTFEVESAGPQILDTTCDRIILDSLGYELYLYEKRINNK